MKPNGITRIKRRSASMTNTKSNSTKKRGLLHPRNPHKGRYDFAALCKACPALSVYIKPSLKADQTIDFNDEKAVLCLNKALLAHFYHVNNWQIPEGYLCPPIPGRADYIHYVADLLAKRNQELEGKSPTGKPPTGKQVKVLDIGTGANCIYPIIGSQTYGWQFVGSDSDPVSINVARVIVQSNKKLSSMIKLILQKDSKAIFQGIIKPKDRFDLTICNPPFHASMAEAQAGSHRKLKNLAKGKKVNSPGKAKLNFGGQNAELWCPGGEIDFIKRMAKESLGFADQVSWFTSLVSKGENIKPLTLLLNKLGATEIEVINMSQGQKTSRIIAWSFIGIGLNM